MSEKISSQNDEMTREDHHRLANTILGDAWNERERDESLQETLHRTNALMGGLIHAMLSLTGPVIEPKSAEKTT